MKILISGGSGFIGSAIVRLAIKNGHVVINIDNLSYSSSVESTLSVSKNKNYFFEKIDIRKKNTLNTIFFKYEPDMVIHCAAESHVDRSIQEPSSFIETNIIGTFNMLEAALKLWNFKGKPNLFRFHHISTDEVYGTLPANPKIKFTEKTKYDPRSPYSASKASSDHLVNAWNATYDLPVMITNCSNNYGPFQFPEKLIPVVIVNAIKQNTISIYGNGENIRDWLHVNDHAEAVLKVLFNGNKGCNYNIGGENETTNLELVSKICELMDQIYPTNKLKYSSLIKFVEDRPGHDKRYAVNTKLIRNELKWKPKISFNEGLKKTIKWYLNNEQWWSYLLYRDKYLKNKNSQ